MRGEAVVETVAGEEEDFAAGHASEEQRGGGQAVGRAHDAPSGDFEFGDVGKAAASDNCQHGGVSVAKKGGIVNDVRPSEKTEKRFIMRRQCNLR